MSTSGSHTNCFMLKQMVFVEFSDDLYAACVPVWKPIFTPGGFIEPTFFYNSSSVAGSKLTKDASSAKKPHCSLELQSLFFMLGNLCGIKFMSFVWHRWRIRAPAGCCCPEREEETAPMGRPRRARSLGKSPDVLWWVSCVPLRWLCMWTSLWLVIYVLYALACPDLIYWEREERLEHFRNRGLKLVCICLCASCVSSPSRIRAERHHFTLSSRWRAEPSVWINPTLLKSSPSADSGLLGIEASCTFRWWAGASWW